MRHHLPYYIDFDTKTLIYVLNKVLDFNSTKKMHLSGIVSK